MNKAQIKKHLVISDLHIPDHNVKAIKLIFKFIADYKPDCIHILGDLVNFTKISSFNQDPYDHVSLNDEVEIAKDVLSDVVRISRRANSKTEIKWYSGNHECFDEKTEILTEGGFIRFENITPATKLITYDKEKNVLEKECPIDKQVFDHKGNLLRIRNRNVDLLITSSHRVYYKPNSSSKWRTTEVKNIPIGNNRVYFRSSGILNREEYPISDDELRISAWVLTDGCYQKRRVSIYQRKSKVHLIEEILERLGWEYSRKERFRDIKEIEGKILKSHESEVTLALSKKDCIKMQNLVPDKHTLPSWVYKLCERQFDVFLSSFIDGDGSRHKSAPETSLMVYGVRKIIDELQVACFQNGYRTSVSEYRPGDFRLNITKNPTTSFYKFKENIQEEYYEGKVWDVTTPNDTVIVRRNGKISITGNCRLIRYLGKNADQLAELNISGEKVISIPHLFELKTLGIKWITEDQYYRIGNAVALHGTLVRAKSGYTAHAMIDKFGMSGLSGHSHRLSLVTRNQYGSQKFWLETGCLCDLTPNYTKYPDWTNGFATLEVDEKGNSYPQIIPILNNSFIYQGKKYEI